MPSSLRYLIRALFLGIPLKTLNKLKAPSSVSLFEIWFFALERVPNKNFLCVETIFSTLGFKLLNSCLSPLGIGPEIIKGVLASSIKTESTSSTIA